MCFVLFLTQNCLDKWDHHSNPRMQSFKYYYIRGIKSIRALHALYTICQNEFRLIQMETSVYNPKFRDPN